MLVQGRWSDYSQFYSANEIIVTGDIGPEVFHGFSIGISLAVLSGIIDFVEGIMLKIVVDEMVESPH